MTTPGVEVACDYLRADADRWSAAAVALRGAQQAAEGITFADKLGAIPQFVGGAENIIANYERVKQKFTAALSGGAVVMNKVSTILDQVADTFEREDREAALRIKQEGADR
jgi:hypothetical protein